jgi:hypothetical protein
MNRRHADHARSAAAQSDYDLVAQRARWLTWLVWALNAAVVLDVIIRLSRYF